MWPAGEVNVCTPFICFLAITLLRSLRLGAEQCGCWLHSRCQLQILVSLIWTAVMQGITTEKSFLESEVMLFYENPLFFFWYWICDEISMQKMGKEVLLSLFSIHSTWEHAGSLELEFSKPEEFVFSVSNLKTQKKFCPFSSELKTSISPVSWVMAGQM